MDKIVFIDTETTGLKPFKGDRVIDIACIEYQNGKKTGRQFNTRLNPEGKSSDKPALKIHGISDSSLIHEPLFKDVLTDFLEIVKMLQSEHFSNRVRINNSRSEWMVNPNHYSRYDGILPLTNINEMDLEEALASLESVSLNGVDNFFQVLRRHLNMLERPVTSGTNGRRWNVYAGYNPEWMTKLVEIKRVYFNYCMTDERTNRAKLKASEVPDPTTPAMRRGLVDKIFNAQDILSFSSTRKFIESELRKKSA